MSILRSVVLSCPLAAAATPFLCASGAIAQTPPQQAISVYYDQAHGEMPPPPPMAELASRGGYTLHLGTGSIDDAALAGHRLVYLRAPVTEITEAERSAIATFVKGGGSLLLVVDEERRQKQAVTRVNDLLAPFGLELTADTPYLHNTGGIAKAGVITSADRELPYSGGRAVTGGTPFAWQLDADGKPGQPFAAYVAVAGGGKVIAMGEGMASLFLGVPGAVRLTGGVRDPATTTYWGKDSTAFMTDVLNWLIAR
jgi:hypothetical protein